MKRQLTFLFISLFLSSCDQMLLSSLTPSSNESFQEAESSFPFSESISSNIESNFSSSQEEIVERKDKNITYFLGRDLDVYRINIQTTNQVFPYDKTTYIPGSLNISEQNQKNILLPSQSMGIRLRGNSTLEAPKKAFRIKFDEKVSLFGLPKAKSWVLLANYFDKSNVRNYLAYLMANKLSNLDFQPSSIFVDVYINQEYQGLYLLTEQMQAGKGRVDIEEDTHSSFLLELDFLDRAQNEGVLNVDYIVVNNRCFNIKYPEPEFLNDETLSSIKEFMKNAMQETTMKRNYEDYLNLPAFIDYYLIQELFKNVDCGNASIYYYLQDNKLTVGPVWDFDIGLDVVGDHDPYYGYQNSDLWAQKNLLFNQTLLSIPSYKQMVKIRYLEIKTTILEQIFEELDIVALYLKNAQIRNVSKWPLPGDLNSYIAARYNQTYEHLSSIEDHYEYLKKTLQKRFAVLDSYLNVK